MNSDPKGNRNQHYKNLWGWEVVVSIKEITRSHIWGSKDEVLGEVEGKRR